MQETTLRAKIEALLFAAGEPVSLDKLSKVLQINEAELVKEVNQLKTYFQETQSGLDIITKDRDVQMVSRSTHGELVAKFLNRELGEELSTAAAEVLSVVAYRGPLTRAQIEQIRGVNCSFTLRNLAMRGLVERKDNPTDSRSYLYEISFDFLKRMGLGSVEELPDYQNLHAVHIATVEDALAAVEQDLGKHGEQGETSETTGETAAAQEKQEKEQEANEEADKTAQ